MSLKIQDFEGMQYPRQGSTEDEQKDYKYFNNQYATSSHGKEHDMNPALIVRPRDDRDIIAAINWARQKKCSIAVKSGGHQYSGASSTGGQNIQIDLSETYKDMKVLPPNNAISQDRAWVNIGVSNRLGDLNEYLKDHGLFVPHGQCAHVGVGGHGQTGGYGQLARGFGLFGDQIIMIRMIDHNGKIREITKESDSELFWAILGGSPGNFGIITHYVVSVYRAKCYEGPHGMRGIYTYKKATLEKILGILATFSDNPKPKNYDLCISVLSLDFDLKKLIPALNDEKNMKIVKDALDKQLQQDSDLQKALKGRPLPAVIVVYASWCPMYNTKDKYDDDVDKWFAQFRTLHNLYDGLFSEEFNTTKEPMDMATMTGKWIFHKPREFDRPYEKRTYSTNSTQLVTSRWAEKVAERVDLIYNPLPPTDKNLKPEEKAAINELYDHCKLAVQIQAFGGSNSQFAANRSNGTSYSWRDSTIVQVLDCFYDTEGETYARKWQKENDAIMIGPNSTFSKKDRRVLWGSWGDWDMSKPEIWKTYYEDQAKYEKLGKARGKADPNGTFTANPFAVTAIKAGLPTSKM